MPFTVFTRAPTYAELKARKGRNWKMVEVDNSLDEPDSSTMREDEKSADWILPPATYAAASQRISNMYKNVIFPEESVDEPEETQVSRGEGATTTFLTQPMMVSRNTVEKTRDMTKIGDSTYEESLNDTYDDSAASSVLMLPSLAVNLHTLSSLSNLALKSSNENSTKVNVLVALLEIEGPNTVTIKKGVGQGSDVSVLRFVVSDESTSIFKVTAWREVADAWGGFSDASASQYTKPRRGDVVYIETYHLPIPDAQMSPSQAFGS